MRAARIKSVPLFFASQRAVKFFMAKENKIGAASLAPARRFQHARQRRFQFSMKRSNDPALRCGARHLNKKNVARGPRW
jgi:hypothetical protein